MRQDTSPTAAGQEGGAWAGSTGVLALCGGRIREICFVTVAVAISPAGCVAWATWRTEAAVARRAWDVWQPSAGREAAGFGSHLGNRLRRVEAFVEGLHPQLPVEHG